MLDFRLQTVASLVRKGSRLADIGTDHALLPCVLVGSDHCPSAIASDVRVGPAEAARRSIQNAELSEKIEVRLGDGLKTVSPAEVDDIVIAGMGGETIADILQAASWTRCERYHFVLQPMTRAEKLRRWLLENGFSIEAERIADDGKRCYTVLSVSYVGGGILPSEAVCLVGKLPLPQAKPYLERVCRRLKKQLQAGENSVVEECLAKVEAYMRGEWSGEEDV